MGIPFRFFRVSAQSDLSGGLDCGVRTALETLQEDSIGEVLPRSFRDFSVHRSFSGSMSGHRVHGIALVGGFVDLRDRFSASADCAAVCDNARLAQADSQRGQARFDQMAFPLASCGIAGDSWLCVLGRSGHADPSNEGLCGSAVSGGVLHGWQTDLAAV